MHDSCSYLPVLHTEFSPFLAFRNTELFIQPFQVRKKHKNTDSASGKENKPAPKKGCVSLKGKEKARSVTTDEALAEVSKGYVAPKAEKNTGWAM